MTEPGTAEAYGTATLTPDEDVVAGSYRTWTVTYRVGTFGMDDGSTLEVAFSQTSDWGTPQVDDPTADNYATVETDGDATRPDVDCAVDDGSARPGTHSYYVLVHQDDGHMAWRSPVFVTVR